MIIWAWSSFNLAFLFLFFLLFCNLIKSLLFAALSFLFFSIWMLKSALTRCLPTIWPICTVNDIEPLIKTSLILFLKIRPFLHKILKLLFFFSVYRVPIITRVILKFQAFFAKFAPVLLILRSHNLIFINISINCYRLNFNLFC